MLEHWQEVIAMVQARPHQGVETTEAPAPATAAEEHAGQPEEHTKPAVRNSVAIGADPFAAG